MSAIVRELNQHFIDLWWESKTSLPDLGPRYTARDQSENEMRWGEFLDEIEYTVSQSPRSREDLKARFAPLSAEFRRLAEETFGLSAAQLDLLPSGSFSEASEEFVRLSREFDPGLTGEDIYQAGRNAWTANGLQWLMGVPVRTTPSILAYSLHYPYTDNYLDDPGIAVPTKLAFNERFGLRLMGESILAHDRQERIIFELIRMIEEEYDRSVYPGVFQSLLDIHRAQVGSLALLHRDAVPGEVDVLGLSFDKGGTSVLADGYLVNGSLAEAQREYTYGHGIFAQLLDDLEDIEQDSQAGRLTMYSQPAGHWPLDALANRTFHFGRSVLSGLDCFDVEEPVRRLIERGADLLLIEAIGRLDHHYSPSYLGELEAHSPFHFSFLRQRRNDFPERHGSLLKLVEGLMLFQRA